MFLKNLYTIITLVFFLFVTNKTLAQTDSVSETEVIIYINSAQCYNCNIVLNAIHALKPGIRKTIYFEEANRGVADELLENYKTVQNKRVNFYNKRELLFGKDGLQPSFCKVKCAQALIDSFELKELFNKNNFINQLGTLPANLHRIPIPDSVRFSDRLSFYASNGFYNVYDYTVNKNVLFAINQTKHSIIGNFTLKPKDFKHELFINSGIVNKAAYYAYLDRMQNYWKTDVHFDAIYLSDSSLNVLMSFPCAHPHDSTDELGGDTAVGSELFLYSKNLFTKKSKVLGIPTTHFITANNQEYDLDNVNGFFETKKKYYFTIFTIKAAKQNTILCEYKAQGKMLTSSRFTDVTVEKRVYAPEDSTFTDFGTNSNAHFYFALNYPLIVNTNNLKSFVVKELIPNKEGNVLYMSDVVPLNNDCIKIIYFIEEVSKLMIYSVSQKKVILNQVLKVPENINPWSLRFMNAIRLMGIDKTNKHLIQFELN